MTGDAALRAALATSEKTARARLLRIGQRDGFATAPRVPMVLDLKPETMHLAAELARIDGALAFAVLPPDAARAALSQALGPDWSARAWDVYEAAADQLLSRARTSAHLPDGWDVRDILAPDDATVLDIARLNQTCGVSPNSGAALRGEFCPIHTVGLYDTRNTLRASATVQMMFPEGGRLSGTGFLGLICVDPDLRGKGLGKAVTAEILTRSHARLGWTAMSAWVAPDNPGSIALMHSFGLTRREDAQALVAMPGGQRFTR